MRREWLAGMLGVLLGLQAACRSSEPEGRRTVSAAPPPAAAAVETAPDAAVADPLALDAAAREWVDSTLSRLTLRQKAAQVVFPWISGASRARDATEYARMLRWVEEDEVGGLIVSRGAPEVLAGKLAAAQARAGVPLLVVSDLETGPGMRLQPGGTEFPPAMAFGAANREDLAREAGRVTAREARAVGIHVTLGPVLDVNSNPDNPIINVRSFGEDPHRVARLSSAWIGGAREGGLLSVGKHFPGHGDTQVDSHVGLAAIPGDSARLFSVELVPFRSAFRAGMDGVMVGHIAMVGLEGRAAPPASLSPRVTGELLRDRLGFQGLAFTDALNMGAITRSLPVGEASVRALLAGADVLLQPPGTPAVIEAVVRAVESGRLPRERLDEAVRRVLVAKARAGLDRPRSGPVSLHVVGAAEHRAVARQVAEASITLVRDRDDLVPFPATARRVLHVVYTASGRGSPGEVLSAGLRASGRTVDVAQVGARTSRAEWTALAERAARADLVVASAYVSPHQYRALDLQGGFAAFVERLSGAGRPVVALSLGSPYLLESFPSVPGYLLAWSATEASERAAARALLGLGPIVGRLPVALPPYYLAGDGLERPGLGE